MEVLYSRVLRNKVKYTNAYGGVLRNKVKYTNAYGGVLRNKVKYTNAYGKTIVKIEGRIIKIVDGE